jgi:hypothetical protein
MPSIVENGAVPGIWLLAGRPAPKEMSVDVSFKDQSHLNGIMKEAEEIVNNALNSSQGAA